MKNKFAITTAIVLIFIALNAILFLTVSEEIIQSNTFQIVWIFTFPVNFLMAIMATAYVTTRKSNSLVRMPPIMYLVYTFSGLYFIAGMIMMSFYFDSIKIPLAIEIAITTAYIIAFLFFAFGINYMETTEKHEKKKISYISLLKADVDMAITYADNADTKKQLEKLAERVRFSDPMSDDSLKACETDIQNVVRQIMADLMANGNADVSKDIERVSELLNYRNERCKILK